MPQMPAPLAPQSGADVSYAYGPRGTAERGRPSEPYSRIPRDASRNAASSPAPNYAPQSGAEASNSYGPRGTAQRGRPSESYNRMPRDASQNGASNPAPSFAPQSGANASYAYGPHNTPQRGRPPESHNRVLNPAPNIAPQSGANAPDAYGSYSTAQRGRPSEPHSRMPRDAGLNTASNGASDFAPQSSSSVPYTYGSHGTAQRRQPSESDSRMPRDAGFNAPSNPSLNAYTPNFAERPVRIDDTCSHTVLISSPLSARRTGRNKSNARAECRRGYPASNFPIGVLFMTRTVQRLLLSLTVILQPAGRGHLRIPLPTYTYRSRQPDIILRAPHRLI